MSPYTLERSQHLPYPRAEVFPFFASPENLAAITPRWLGFTILTPAPIEMKVGTVIDYAIHWLGIPVRWKTLITTYEPGRRFVDEQIAGPYALWHHTHTFEDAGGGTTMTDRVVYALPFGPLGDLAHSLMVRRQLEEIFDYRAAVLARLLEERLGRRTAR